jgi:hypothetical protein
MHKNPLVDFLATYGPTAGSQSMYDEHVLNSAAMCDVKPLSVESSRVESIIAAITGPDPRSVILTGTAGDGKTWHCRNVFERLGGSDEEWQRSKCIEKMLPSNRKLIVVKDLSQFADTEPQDEIVAGLFASACGQSEDLYLIAANDGQMLRTLRRYASQHENGRRAEEAIRTMLKDDAAQTTGLRLDLWNLSRQPHDELFERLLNAVTEHDAWSYCEGCSALAGCPIPRNRDMLRQRGVTGLRARLRDMIRIAADNGMHLPIRQVLLLIVNVLLGVGGRRTPLLNCHEAQSLLVEQTTETSNPYDNVFGLNLGTDAKTFRAFNVLGGFGIGRETNNSIDGLLLDAEPADMHEKYVANDEIFVGAVFEDVRRQYRRGDSADHDEFREAIERQRRRLFFILPPTDRPSQNEFDPWRLSVFMHAGEYLKFASGLANKEVDKRVRGRLAVGLNRTYTGVMCDEGTQMWFAAPAANAQSRIGQVLDIKMPVGETRMIRVHFDFDAGGSHKSLRMVVREAGGREGPIVIASNALQPLLFEYLLRVDGGSLPGSFSRQCYEELRQFRLRVVAALDKRELIDADGVSGITIVSLAADGRLHEDEIGIISARAS